MKEHGSCALYYKSSVKWVESGLEQRDIINSPEVCHPLCTCFICPLSLAAHHLKFIIDTGICREPVVKVTFVIKRIKGLWVGQILLASFQWMKAGRVLCALPKQKFPNKMKGLHKEEGQIL